LRKHENTSTGLNDDRNIYDDHHQYKVFLKDKKKPPGFRTGG